MIDREKKKQYLDPAMSRKRAREIEIPLDALEEILSLLPSQSLFRFTCINKACCSIIRNPTFISKHLLNHRFDHVLLNLTSPGNKFKFSLLESPDHLGVLGNMDKDNVSEDLCIVGQCDGLICFTTGAKNPKTDFDFTTRPNAALHLWNPATRQHKILPESNILLPRPGRSRRVGLGFGHDPKSRDYKVVRCAIYHRWLQSESDVEAEVYSLRTNSWRPVASSPVVLVSLPETRTGGVYSGGCCYWLGHKLGIIAMIVSYDMSNDVFRQFPIPEPWYPFRDSTWCNLFAWKGSLALVRFPSPIMYPDRARVRFIDIWSLEVDIDGSLTLKEHRDLYLDVNTVMDVDVHGLLRLKDVELLCNDDLIIKYHNNDLPISEARFKAYCVPTGQIRNISLAGTCCLNTRMVGYTPSFVSLLT